MSNNNTNKSSVQVTFIAGSTAAGSLLPPHFQLKTKAKDEDKKIQDAFVEGVPYVEGVYGDNKLTANGITVNCNATAGMDSKEFHQFMMDSIVKLFPDAADLPRKRVLIIVDSGPGRRDLSLLAKLKARGFYLHAGVPNTTHVTQPTDQKYGPFKSMYRRNLESLVCFRRERNNNVRQNDFPLLVFGHRITSNEEVLLEPAFDKAFSVANSKAVWAKIGISPFIRRCLRDSKVAHELIILEDGTIDLTADPDTIALVENEEKNAKAVKLLNDAGFNGNVFKKCAPRKKKQLFETVTLPNSRARQDALASAKYSIQQFIITGGDTLNTKDYFIAEERKQRQEHIKGLESLKKKAKAVSEFNAKVTSFIEEYASKGKNVHNEEDAKSLPVSTLKLLCKWKQQKKVPAKKQELVDLWLGVKDISFPPEFAWSDEDENRLQRLKEDEITIRDTALGKERARLQKESLNYIASMTEEERAACNMPVNVLEGLKEMVVGEVAEV